MKLEVSFDKMENLELLKIEKNNKHVYLGSKFNMRREIENFRGKFDKINKKHEVIIFGAAGGSWISEFVEEFKDRDIVFVEPTEDLKNMLEQIINKIDINVNILSLEEGSFEKKLKLLIKKRFIDFIVFSNYDLVFSNEVYNLKEKIKDCVIDKTINENTAIAFSKDWFMNYLSNIVSIFKDNSLNSYKDVYKGKPAIIVSAGPSLEKNIHLLKGNEDKFVIITGIRTLYTLKKEGINCDFACVIDGSEAMYKVSKDSLKYDIPLFYSDGANKKIINEYEGNKIYFTSPNYFKLNRRLGDFGTDVLYQGGSVAHSCTAIAEYLGCNPIVFIGQDLAYTNNQIHASNATIQGEQLKTDKYDLMVEGVNGGVVPTSYSLDTFRKAFESMIELNDEVIYINATEGGANIKGTEVKLLKDVIEKFDEKIDKIPNEKSEKDLNEIKLVESNLKNNLQEIIKLKKLAREAVMENKQLVNKYLKNNKEFKNSLKKLDNIDNKFREKRNEFLLINSIFAPIIKEMDIAFYDEKIDNFENEIEHIKFIADKGEKLYKKIEETIIFSIPYINEAISKLEDSIHE